MTKKKNTAIEIETPINTNIDDMNFEDIISKCFGRYAKYIIQERALPDARDGLKPVQRRIIYAMNSLKLTYDYQFKKSARIVGEVIGKYHPHGDTSVYEALVRMSQHWKYLHPLIWMHGNNGSIDGDSAAAMRYTEAKLTKISNLLIGEIDKNTIDYQDNFDESEREPVIFASKIPNLLLNGSTGIAAGYATDIPPHNLIELIDGIDYRIKNPNCGIEEIMHFIKGPDFPTGCNIILSNGISGSYKTGKGKIVIEAKSKIIAVGKNEHIIEITEIPYNILKSNIVKEIFILREKNNLNMINEIRDDSGKEGLKIIVGAKANIDDTNKLLEYLLANTSLRINYNFNMVAIVDNKPKLLGLLQILDKFISFQEEITVKAAKYDLEITSNKLEIANGLVKAMGMLDDIIKLIRKATSRSNVIEELVNKFEFTERQATSIADLKLYRLCSTDVSILSDDIITYGKIIQKLNEIINNKKVLDAHIIKYLDEIKKEFGVPRRTHFIHKDLANNKVSKVVIEENVQCVITRAGYLKNISRKYNYEPNIEQITTKNNDIIIFSRPAKTTDYLMLITDQGNYLIFPVHEVKITKEKEDGTSIFDLRKVKGPEHIIFATVLEDFNPEENNIDLNILFLSKYGKAKMSNLIDFTETKIKAMQCFKLNDGDFLMSAKIVNKKYALILTNLGQYTFFELDQISIFGIKTGGISALKLGKGEYIREIITLNDGEDLGIVLTNGELLTRNVNSLRLTKRNRIPQFFPDTTKRNKARYLFAIDSYKSGYWLFGPDDKTIAPVFLSKVNTLVFKTALKKFNKLTAMIIIIQNNVIKNTSDLNE